MFKLENISNWVLAILFGAASIIALIWSHIANYQFIYNDSVSYLNIPRMVLENAQPGLEQLGTIWLPLNHLSKLPFIWNNQAYESGLAGSIISMLSYLVAVLFVYKITSFLTKSRLASIVAVIIFGFNPNWLYLQSTPLSEALFMALFLVSAYAFCRYTEKRDIAWLVLLSIINALMVLTRYEAWFVLGIQAVLLFLLYTPSIRTSLSEIATRMTLFIMPSLVVIALWLLWNHQITGNIFYFLNGELSASAFTERQQSSGVVASGDILISIRLFVGAAIRIVGLLPILVSIAGFLAWLWQREELLQISNKLKNSSKKMVAKTQISKHTRTFDHDRSIDQYITYKKVVKIAIITLLLAPSIFHVVSLFLGFSSVKIAGIGGDVVSLNLRYSIYLLPSAAIGAVMLMKSRLYYMVTLFAVLVSYALMIAATPESITDAVEGAIQYERPAQIITENVEEGDMVLMSFATNSPLAFYADVDLDQYVHEGFFDGWETALNNPQDTVEWVVVSERFEFDPINQERQENPNIFEGFSITYSDKDITLYEKD